MTAVVPAWQPLCVSCSWTQDPETGPAADPSLSTELNLFHHIWEIQYKDTTSLYFHQYLENILAVTFSLYLHSLMAQAPQWDLLGTILHKC